ncbi:MAG: polysaccharide pyruvyl transferase family protein [Oscillospiraceae bacterium]|nr:polysaccharide pyruvyl transferase family protein [Oscillospiraceae bacterium]
MKKVGILTIHNAYNYGAMLQAYATQRTFDNFGVYCELIDYFTQFSEENKKFFRLPKSLGDVKNNIRNLAHPISFFQRKSRFKNFIKANMVLSKEKFTLENINEVANSDYDYLVTGSDQTFNLNLNSHKEYLKPYFLPFKFDGKKASYSSSMGEKMHEITEEQKEWMRDKLSDYDAISVREPVAADYIENLISKRPEVVYDPTLALSREEWDKVCDTEIIKEKYILFYTVLSEPWVIEYVKKVSKQTGLKVIAVHPQNSYEVGCGFKRLSNSGPSQFINLIKNAELILTTSFHGTVFSMIYEKPFYSIVLGEGNRIRNLLSQAGLEERIITKEKTLKEIEFGNEDMKQLKEFFEKTRSTNYQYLKSLIV